MKRAHSPVWRLVGLLALLGAAACTGAPSRATPTPPPAPGTPVSGGVVLTPGAQVSASIRRGQVHRFTFQGEAGLAVTIDMEAGPGSDLDSYLELLAPDGSTLATNDDGGGDASNRLDSRISNFVLPASGEYTIVARAYRNRTAGSYSLQVALGTPAPATPTPPPAPTSAPGGGPIAVGEALSGTIDEPGQVDVWTFEAEAGDIVTIDLRVVSGLLDPYLALVGPDGGTLVVDDDSGGGLNARIANFILPQSGEYAIHVSGLADMLGEYDLALSAGQPPSPTPAPPTAGPSPTPFERTIELGQTLESTIPPQSGGDHYRFRVEEPVVVDVLVQAAGADDNLFLNLFGPEGLSRSLIDYSSTSSLIFLPNVVLRQRGDYSFRVLNFDDHPITYTFTLEPSRTLNGAGGEIAYNQGVSGELLFSGQEDLWTFEGRAGDVVTLIMHGINMRSTLTLLHPDGSELIQVGERGNASNVRIDSYTLPDDGVYTIVAGSSRGGGSGPYRLQLFLERARTE